MSRRTAIYLSLFIIVPIVFFIVRMGPVKAMSQWKEASLWVKSDITDIINRFMIKTKEELGYGMSSIQTTPEVKILDLDEPILMWSFPSQVAFQGDSTEGKFHGIYYTRTHRVVGTVDVKGKTYNVKATTSNGHVTFEP